MNTAVLSVSRVKYLNCEDLALFLSKSGIVSNVTSNVTIQPNLEYGCQITQPIEHKEEVKNTWLKLQGRYGFDCAHLKIDGIYSGCILDFIRPSLCGKNIEN